MQYILTQEEYDKLKSDQTPRLALSNSKLQKLCTKICDEMPIDRPWSQEDPKPWGCILSTSDWYCDLCPVQKICPHTAKEWSK
jgi:hypothetical protein